MGVERTEPHEIGSPRLHLRTVGSTNTRARELADGGAGHGTLVTSWAQTAGRGRQGRAWAGVAGRALAASYVLRDFDALLSLRAGLTVADLAGTEARVKWPNDVLVGGRKVAGILVEGRPQHGWAVLGIGINVAVELDALPVEARAVAATLGRTPAELEPTLAELTAGLSGWLAADPAAVVAALTERDALRDRLVDWPGGSGTGAGIDADGALLVRRPDGTVTALNAGEVHLGTAAAGG